MSRLIAILQGLRPTLKISAGLCLVTGMTLPVTDAATMFVDPMFGVNVSSDVVYGTSAPGVGAPRPRLLDIYTPTNIGTAVPTNLPAIVLMHGGFFISGSKTNIMMTTLANEFASRGYVAASINYRLLPELPNPPGNPITHIPARVPGYIPGQIAMVPTETGQVPDIFDYNDEIAAAVADQAMAVNYLAANSGALGIDSRRIAAGGYSAGAVSSLALGAGVVDGVTADIGAVVSFAGGLFGQETFLDPNDAAVFFVHGDQDTTVPFVEAGFLQAGLNAQGIPSSSIILNGVGHGGSSLRAGVLDNGINEQQLFQFTITQLNNHAAVPEPSGVIVLALGCVGLAVRRRRSA